jgi:hypothetical protein
MRHHPTKFVASLLLCAAILTNCKQPQTASNLTQTQVTAEAANVWPEVKKETRPWTRWWWMGNAVDKVNLEEELSQFHDAGIGGVEITPIYGAKGYESKYLDFLSPQWMDMLHATVSKANNLGMGVDINVGTGWPFGGPQIAPQYAAGKLVIQTYTLKGGQKLSEKIAVQDTLQKRLGAPLKALTAYSDKGETLNILNKVDATGNLNWSPKSGNWEIYAAFSGHTAQKVKRAAPGGTGLVLDHFNKAALDVYLKRFDQAFAGKPTGIRSYFNDSYEVYFADFTPNFFEEFQKRRGYDVRNHLRELVSKENSDKIARIRTDYRETMTEMVYENFSVPFHQWVNGKNGLSRNQAHGFPGNILDIYGNVAIPEPETFGQTRFPIPGMIYDAKVNMHAAPDPVMIKFASSAANVLGKPLTSCETFTWLGEHFKSPLSHCKPEVEQAFLSGVNHVFFHGSTYSPKEAEWPGWLFYASTNFTPGNSFWPHLKGLNDYITRCQSVLQLGRADREVLIYWPYYDVLHKAPAKLDMQISIHEIPDWLIPTPFYKNAMQLMKNGYSVDFVSDKMVAQSQVNNGILNVSDKGAAYQVLVIPQTDHMPVETFRNILKLANNGATIVLQTLPQDVPGLQDLDARRQQLKQLTSALNFTDAGQGVKQAQTGNGQILLSEDVQKALDLKNIAGENLTASGLKFIRRNVNGNKYYYLVNHTANKVDTFVPLNVQASSVMILDPQNGNYGLAGISSNGSKTKVRLQVEPGEAIILQTSRDKTLTGPAWKYLQPESQAMAINGTWNVTFTTGGPELPKPQILPKLNSWTEFTDANAKRFAGSAEYTTTFDLPNKNANDYVLDLGDVRESAKVWINGQEVGILWSVPFRANVGQYLKKGKNTLKVEVANVSANRIKDMDMRKVEWRKFHEINFVNLDYKPFDASGWDWQPSGLLGPVTLTPYKIATQNGM